MAQVDIPPQPAASYVGIESTYGTTPGMTRMFPRSNTFDVSGLMQKQVPVMDERPRLFHAISHQFGLKSASKFKLQVDVRPDGTQLTHGTLPVTHWLGQNLQGWLGNVQGSSYTANTNGGALVNSTGSSTSAVQVQSGQGANFVVGQWAWVQTSSGQEPFRIINISGDVLTPYPNFAGTPVASTGVVINSYTYAPAQTHSASMTYQHAKATNSSWQWTMNGCTPGSLKFSYKRGEIPTITADMMCATWTGPSAQSLSTAFANDTMNAPFVVASATTLVQTPATTTRVQYALHELDFDIEPGMQYLQELGGVQGTTGVFRGKSDGLRPLVKGSIKFRTDTAIDADWAAGTLLGIILIQTQGSGLTQQFTVVDLPLVELTGKPSPADSGGRLVYTAPFECQEDASCTSPSTDLAYAPVRFVIM